MYLCLYIRTHTAHTHARTHTHTHTQTHTNTHIHAHYTYTYMHTFVYIYTHISVHKARLVCISSTLLIPRFMCRHARTDMHAREHRQALLMYVDPSMCVFVCVCVSVAGGGGGGVLFKNKKKNIKKIIT